MTTYTTPINANNFSEAFEHVEKLTARNSKKALIRKIVLPLGSIIFLLFSLLMTLGLMYSFSDAEDMFMFEMFPFIITFWDGLAALYADLPNLWYITVPVYVLTVYLVPLIICGVLAALIALLYRGKRIEAPTGTAVEQAKGLHELAEKIPNLKRYYDGGHSTAATVCSLLYVLTLVAFLLFAMFKGSFVATGALVTTLIGMAICAAIVYFIYRLLFRLFIFLNSRYYAGGSIPSNIVGDTDAYWLSLDPAEGKHREEEIRKANAEYEARRAKAIASGKACYKCAKTLGISGGYEVSGKLYCWECSKTIPRTYVDYKCYQCAYYRVDENYDGRCKRDYDRIVDRYQTACSNFSK